MVFIYDPCCFNYHTCLSLLIVIECINSPAAFSWTCCNSRSNGNLSVTMGKCCSYGLCTFLYSNYALNTHTCKMHIHLINGMAYDGWCCASCLHWISPNFQFLLTKNDVDKAMNSYQSQSLISLPVNKMQYFIVLVCMHSSNVLALIHLCSGHSIKATCIVAMY